MSLPNTTAHPDRDNRILNAWQDGGTTDGIAFDMHINRNIVAGVVARARRKGDARAVTRQTPKVFRPRRHRAMQAPALVERRRVTHVSPKRHVRATSYAARAAAVIDARERVQHLDHQEIPATAVQFIDLERHHCRWQHGPANGYRTAYCGHTVEPGKSFCRAHTEQAFDRWVEEEGCETPERDEINSVGTERSPAPGASQ